MSNISRASSLYVSLVLTAPNAVNIKCCPTGRNHTGYGSLPSRLDSFHDILIPQNCDYPDEMQSYLRRRGTFIGVSNL